MDEFHGSLLQVFACLFEFHVVFIHILLVDWFGGGKQHLAKAMERLDFHLA